MRFYLYLIVLIGEKALEPWFILTFRTLFSAINNSKIDYRITQNTDIINVAILDFTKNKNTMLF